MISLQLEDVRKTFQDLAALEANSWIPTAAAENEQENQRPRAKKRPLPAKPKALPPAAGAAKSTAAASSVKEMMAAKRRQMMQQQQQPVDISVPATPLPPAKGSEAEKVFEGGFFSVRSPMRKIEPRSDASPAVRKSGLAFAPPSQLNFEEGN